MSCPLSETVSGLLARARATRQRRCLVLAGGRPWGIASALTALDVLGREALLWVSDRPPADCPALAPTGGRELLGRELTTVVMDAYAGFDPETFGALAGTLCGGGLLLLICPPLKDWPAFADPLDRRITVAPYPPAGLAGRYRARLVRQLREVPGATLITEGEPPAWPTSFPTLSPPALPLPEGECRTPDQAQAVQALEHLVGGHRRRPLVLVSDRGRGKSSALGIGAARLLRRGVIRVLLTGPRLEAVRPALAHAARLLPQAAIRSGRVEWGGRRLEFMPPDALAVAPVDPELVLVDEAAALPAPLLERLLRRFRRIAFATTVHGYEGTGRGFAVRFRRVLDRLTPEWRELRLETPIRWAPGDPLERLAFRALLLDAEPAPAEALADLAAREGRIRVLDRDQLARDEPRLRELFGLLVLAHYRTSPLDLAHLLDGPNVSVVALEHRGHVAATALLADEGGLDAATARQVWLGRRRLQGHLLPQSLAQHLGLARAPGLHLRRVMRIAVHPQVQGRGLGSRLLAWIAANSPGHDALGTSFGADVPLLRFWRRGGFLAVRLGLRRDAASGSHSVQMLRPLNDRGEGLLWQARRRCTAHLPYQLGDPLRALEPGLAVVLLAGLPLPREPALSDEDWSDLVAVAHGRRQPETAAGPLWRLACRTLMDPGDGPGLGPEGAGLLVARVLQGRSWSDCAGLLGLAGRGAAQALLRDTLAALVPGPE